MIFAGRHRDFCPAASDEKVQEDILKYAVAAEITKPEAFKRSFRELYEEKQVRIVRTLKANIYLLQAELGMSGGSWHKHKSTFYRQRYKIVKPQPRQRPLNFDNALNDAPELEAISYVAPMQPFNQMSVIR